MAGRTQARQIYRALDAAAEAGTDPSISQYPVRAATVVEHRGKEHVIVGGNTDWENLLVVCGQGSDHTVKVRRFSDAIVSEEEFPLVAADDLSLSKSELGRLVEAAQEVRRSGVRLFTSTERHMGAAAMSFKGRLYRAAGVDDAAFHYRYPIGGLLQQAASESDYFLRAVVVAGEPGRWPRVSYRERQYGNEFSRFNLRKNMEPIQLILTDGRGAYRRTTFEEALPHAFSTDAFMPGRVEEFLDEHTKK